jgi:hypothetical protein
MKPLLLALAALIALPAFAQTQVRQAQVYRCGPDGRDLRDSPCPGGPAASSAIHYDEPSAADSRAARERHLADAKQAAALAASRRASEAEARHQRAQSLGLQPPPAAASAPQVVHAKPPKLARPARPHKPRAAASAAR